LQFEGKQEIEVINILYDCVSKCLPYDPERKIDYRITEAPGLKKCEMKSKKGHLPLHGIGPALCWPMAVLSAVGIYLSQKQIIPGAIENKAVRVVITL